MSGWVKLYRILLDKPIWRQSTPEQKTILITLLLMANHEPNEWEWHGKKFVVQPGQFVTSLPAIQKRCGSGVSIRNIRTALSRFEKFEFLTVKSSKGGRLISILNWVQYQGFNNHTNETSDRRVTDKLTDEVTDEVTDDLGGRSRGFPGRVTDKLTDEVTDEVTANKKYKKIKEAKENIYSPNPQRTIFDYWNEKGIIRHRVLDDATRRKIKTTLESHTGDEILQAIDNYSFILSGDYSFTYRWTLKDFLARGLDKFLDLEVAKTNYPPGRFGKPSARPSTNTQRALEAAQRLLAKEANPDDS